MASSFGLTNIAETTRRRSLVMVSWLSSMHIANNQEIVFRCGTPGLASPAMFGICWAAKLSFRRARDTGRSRKLPSHQIRPHEGGDATATVSQGYLPAALPTIFVGVRLASASAVLVLVAPEMLGARAGLGHMIIYDQYSFFIPQMYFGTLAITAIGLTFNYTLEELERRFTRWKAVPTGA
jgi:Binding-protein-dependent transport system inner membrane component